MVIVWPVEGAGLGGDWDQESSSLSVMMMTSGRRTGLIDMISHVDNGGCMKEEHTLGLGQVIGTNVGVRKGWQQR